MAVISLVIDAIGTLNKRELKALLAGVERANITVRNFPLAVSQLRSYQEDAGDYAGHNRLAMKVRATAQLNGAIDQLNVTASAACPVWTGSAWETQATSNPAWWFLWFARGRHDAGGRRLYGAALPDSRIDLEAIKAWAAWCDHKKLTCNLVLNQQKSIAEVLGIIARCGRASPTWQTGRLGVVWDVDNAPVSCVFAPFNIRSGSFRVEYTGDQTADEVIVQFMNPETWQTDEVRAVVPGVTMPSNPVTLQLEGCTDVGMAGREANLLAASQEIEKLTLLSPPQPISVAYLQETIIRHAHFTPFQLVDTLLEGKVNRAQRILLALRAEGTEPGMLAWTLCRELEQLTELALAARAGQPLVEHFSRLRIWQSRQQLIQQALTRLPFPKIRQLWQLMAQLDHAQRHFDTEQAWLMLQTIALGFRDGTPLPLLETESC